MQLHARQRDRDAGQVQQQPRAHHRQRADFVRRHASQCLDDRIIRTNRMHTGCLALQ